MPVFLLIAAMLLIGGSSPLGWRSGFARASLCSVTAEGGAIPIRSTVGRPLATPAAGPGGGAAAAPVGQPVRRALDADQPVPTRPGAVRGRSPGRRRIVINIPAFRLYLYDGGRVLKSYPVAVGRPVSTFGNGYRVRSETPTGEFVLVRKDPNPYWYPPAWLKKVMGWPDDYRVPPGPNNPLGARWLAIWREGYEGYGLHGTPDPSSLGQAVSLGCVRLQNRDVAELFDLVEVGAPVDLIYEPVYMYTDAAGMRHLTLAPDIYGRGGDLAALARLRLRRARVDEAVLAGEKIPPDGPRDLVLAAGAMLPAAGAGE